MRKPRMKFVMNVSGRSVSASAEVCENLVRQLTCPVRFRQSVELLLSKGYDAFLEIGPGKTLSNMIKRTAKAAKADVRLYQFNSLEHIEKIRAEISDQT